MPECRVEGPVQSYISLCTDRWKAIITSRSSWWVMGSHHAGQIQSAAAEAHTVPGAGCSHENPMDVVWCLAQGGIVAICSVALAPQTVCKSSLVPQKYCGLEQARGGKESLWGNGSRIDFRLVGSQGEKACFCSITQMKETKNFRCRIGTFHQYYIYS